MIPNTSRRSFLKTSAKVVVASQFGINILHAQNKGDKLRLAIIGTEPGSTSQRNAERAGFRVAYNVMSFSVPKSLGT